MDIRVAIAGVGIRRLRIIDRAVALVRVSLGSVTRRCIRRRWLFTGRRGIADGLLILAGIGCHSRSQVVRRKPSQSAVTKSTR